MSFHCVMIMGIHLVANTSPMQLVVVILNTCGFKITHWKLVNVFSLCFLNYMLYYDFTIFAKQSLQYPKLGLKWLNRDKKVTLYRYQKLSQLEKQGSIQNRSFSKEEILNVMWHVEFGLSVDILSDCSRKIRYLHFIYIVPFKKYVLIYF